MTAPLPVAYEADKCKPSEPDWFWCATHDSPLGDRADGWAGCVYALVTDLRAVADAFGAAQERANALLENDYPAYEALMMEQIVPGLRISDFLTHFVEPEP